jgi:hypothetical protein
MFAVTTIAGMTLLQSPAIAQDTNPAVVLEWNQVLQQSAAVAAAGPVQSRHYAMVYIAMFDAANSIARQYAPFHATYTASSGASLEAAAAQAARDVMTGLFGQQAVFDATLNARLATVAPGRRMQGIAIGKAAAREVLAWRQNDGAFGPASTYLLPNPIAGHWQPTGAGVPAGLTQMPRALPFTVLTNTQFLVPRHPEINSAKYAEDFNEVKLLGKSNSGTRTAHQTETALIWANQTLTATNLFQIWNNVMRDTVTSQHLTLLEAARGFALMNASMFDGLMTSMSGKFAYGLWRQWDAIRRADTDFNDATEADPTWSPLLGTPPYPTYPGNMACLGAAAARTLALVAGRDDVQFSATWKGNPGYPDVTRHYQGFWQMALEEGNSRIYGGIHFRFDNDASQVYCPKVAEWAHAKVKHLH